MLFLAPSDRRLRGFKPTRPTLALLKATYVTATSITLAFNQPIDISSIAVNSTQVTDGPGGHLYLGTAATLVGPSTVKITLINATAISGPNVKLDFAAPTGIKTIPDGDEWAGVSGLVLPYP